MGSQLTPCRMGLTRSPNATTRLLTLYRTQVTDTESLRSSIFNYKWENGRRYHAYGEGTYW